MTRIKKINLEGFRGVQSNFVLDLEKTGQPLLLYGDNGSGKSTIADAIEWFLFDKVSHLKGEEIAKKHDGIRNKDISESQETSVELEFSNNSFNGKKELKVKGDKYQVKTTPNDKDKFKEYLSKTNKENIVIRNDQLINFIVSTKSERLADISELIGYGEVTKLKGILRKAVGDISSAIKAKAYESQITSKQSQLLETIKANVYDDTQFLKAVDNIVKPLKLEGAIDNWEKLNALKKELEKVEIGEDEKNKAFIKEALSRLNSQEEVYSKLVEDHKDFVSSYEELVKNKEKIKGLRLKLLLDSAREAIEKQYHENESCPVCLTEMPTKDLLSQIKVRVEELKVLEENKTNLDESRNYCLIQVKEAIEPYSDISRDDLLNKEIFKKLSGKIKKIFQSLELSKEELSKNINLADECQYNALNVSLDDRTEIISDFNEIDKQIKPSANPKIKIGQAIVLAESLYKDYVQLSKEKEAIKAQRDTLERIYNDFTTAQKQELERFLGTISSDMNSYFKFMNPNDDIDQVELKTIENTDGDFVGIAYHLNNFRGATLEAPKAYMSESYLNCLGLCLFLASVKSFNKENKFFVLDDVVSSFDKKHRTLFARLLSEKFSDWQPVVLTHEDEWFSILASMVRGKNWKIKTTKWNNKTGTSVELKIPDLKSQIDKKFADNDSLGLGNLLGRYTEALLKQLCENLEARLPFRANSSNEDRSFEDLFNALKARLKDKKTGLDQNVVITNLATTQFFRNKTSHGNGFGENINDMKVCYDDLVKFENVFTCSKGYLLSVKYYDQVTQKIRTKSGELEYKWA